MKQKDLNLKRQHIKDLVKEIKTISNELFFEGIQQTDMVAIVKEENEQLLLILYGCTDIIAATSKMCSRISTEEDEE